MLWTVEFSDQTKNKIVQFEYWNKENKICTYFVEKQKSNQKCLNKYIQFSLFYFKDG